MGEQVVEVADLLDNEATQLEVGRMLRQLFEWDDKDDEEHNVELGVAGEDREARAMDGESAVEQKSVVEPEDQARYNKFMDTFFRRLNADARSSIDPMEVGIMPKKKKPGKPKTGKKKPGKKQKNKNNKKQNKNKKKG